MTLDDFSADLRRLPALDDDYRESILQMIDAEDTFAGTVARKRYMQDNSWPALETELRYSRRTMLHRLRVAAQKAFVKNSASGALKNGKLRLYMITTADDLELPLAVSDNLDDLAAFTGRQRSTLVSYFCRSHLDDVNRKAKKVRYYIVDVDYKK